MEKKESADTPEIIEDQDENLESDDDTQDTDSDSITLTQSDLDRLVQEKIYKALKTREEKEQIKLDKEKEEKLVLEQNYKELAEQYRSKLHEIEEAKKKSEYENEVHALVSENECADMLPILMKIGNIDLVKESIELINNRVDSLAEAKIGKKLENKVPRKSTKQNKEPSLQSMTRAEWAESDKRKEMWGRHGPQ